MDRRRGVYRGRAGRPVVLQVWLVSSEGGAGVGAGAATGAGAGAAAGETAAAGAGAAAFL